MPQVLDPNLVLRETVRGAVSTEQYRELEDTLGSLGRKIYGWLVKKLRSVRIGDGPSEAADAFQLFCLKVDGCLRRRDSKVGESWFWAVARTTFLNHVERTLKKRRGEESLETGGGGNDEEGAEGRVDWLLALTGSATAAEPEWSEKRMLDLARRCMKRLPARMREFLRYDLLEGLPREEIAARMGLEPKSHAANKAKALRRLRDELLKELGTGL